MKERVAIIGSGIAGMTCAHFLQHKYDIILYEKNEYVGGHTHTVMVDDNVRLDTGFMVFNEVTYPNLLKLFKQIGQDYVDTDMGFAVSSDKDGIEYNGSSLSGLFVQRKNILNPYFIHMLWHVQKFFKQADTILADKSLQNVSVGEYVRRYGFSQRMLDQFLVPMASAVWSTPPDRMVDFPIQSLVRFFKNHGFMGLDTQYQWKTPKDRSWSYRDKLIAPFKDRIQTNSQIESVEIVAKKVEVRSSRGTDVFDKVIFASHADETRMMLKKPNLLQQELLAPFHYQKNVATVHTDDKVMPRIKRNWRSWNYVIRKNRNNVDEVFTVYWMNSLQNVSQEKDYFVSINGEELIDPACVKKQSLIIIHYLTLRRFRHKNDFKS